MVTLHGNEEVFRRSMNQGHSAAWDCGWEEAGEHYSRALQEFPDNSPTLNSLALAHFELGNLAQALELYKRAARLSPEDPLPVEKTALIYKQTGRTSEAVEYSMRAAELYHKLRDADKAINNWTRDIRLDPVNIDALAQLAQLFGKISRRCLQPAPGSLHPQQVRALFVRRSTAKGQGGGRNPQHKQGF